jgi:hypothetical protein
MLRSARPKGIKDGGRNGEHSQPPAHEGFPAMQVVTAPAYGGREARMALVVALRVNG